MKKLLFIFVLIVLFACEKEKIEVDCCPVCAFQSSKEQLKSSVTTARTQDNYFIVRKTYDCKNCGNNYELYFKEKIQ